MKTRVSKRGNAWWVLYNWPYSGFLTIGFPTWEEAMTEAYNIEKMRGWM